MNILVGVKATLTPQGHIHIEIREDKNQPRQLPLETAHRIFDAFQGNASVGILHLASAELVEDLPPILDFWRNFGCTFLRHLCTTSDLEESRNRLKLSPPMDELADLVVVAPLMEGGEYLSLGLLNRYWYELLATVQGLLLLQTGSVQAFLHTLNPTWNLVGRVCFHLAENKQNTAQPFAFLATYTNRVSASGAAQHVPLGRALQEFSGTGKKKELLSLLNPVQKAAERSAFLKKMLDASEIFHSLAWTPEEALFFLKEIPLYESAGIVVRVPDWWKAKHPPHPEVRITVGKKKAAGLGIDAMLDFNVDLSLEGETLGEAEWQEILQSTSSLVSIRGHWVEIDKKKLQEVLAHWHGVQAAVGEDGISFFDAMRLLAGASRLGDNRIGGLESPAEKNWCRVDTGDWLTSILSEVGNPNLQAEVTLGTALKATLRPYQKAGVQWLWLLHRLKLGACLADDMGLGKTIQVLALLLLLKQKKKGQRTLLVVPVSLIGNWLSEAKKFAPSLDIFALHTSSLSGEDREKEGKQKLETVDLTITTYGLLTRFSWISTVAWNLVVLDEAQAIKNPAAKQTVAAKGLKSEHRIVLTGTPVENRLSDLWSLFDFVCPGLLGGAKVFGKFIKEQDNPYPALRTLVRPYILRRLKTDRSIIADLPEKTEVRAYCPLSKIQAGLYKKAVVELEQKIKNVEGIQRRGIILSFLMRFKQICNHPSHWLGDGIFSPKESGKFTRLGEICEEIASRQEKVLIFTQFREMTEVLAGYLTGIFGREGLVLHGQTPAKQRHALVDAFQSDEGPPFFILSVKAGGTGLTLTAASHVIHFDRWWNPAVENQATDRAFRIGQKRNVLVHKFICRGTIEEKIDAMLEGKKALSSELLEGSGNAVLTELSNEDLINLVSLDIQSVMDVSD